MHRKMNRVRAEMGFSLIVAGLVAISFLVTLSVQPARSEASAQAGAQDNGAADLYVTNCAGCHQPDGEGIPGTFPPLAGNPNATDGEYVAVVITDGKSGSIEVLGETYNTEMPPVSGLTDDEVAALSAFVVDLAGGQAGADEAVPEQPDPDVPPPPAAPPVAGDADRGHDLFAGSDQLDAGGGTCASCHTAGDVGNLGGSSLGPDLTDVYDKFGGEAGLSAWLANPGSPTMIPIFADRPLTDAEIEDLVAFLADAPDRDKPSYAVDWLTIAGLAGFAILIGGMAIAWRGMRQTYVQMLRSKR
jgi:mono/diheme cytochrome c family protein